MKNIFIAICLITFFVCCKKDKFTTAPQIEYISIIPNATSISLGSAIPILTFSITDKEGDIGLKPGVDTSYVYLVNNLTGKSDSLPFPNLRDAAKSNFKGDVSVSISSVLECKSLPSGALHTDTLYFNVYVMDFDRNKSNVFTTGEPVYFTCR